jgi:hypothetical protein
MTADLCGRGLNVVAVEARPPPPRDWNSGIRRGSNKRLASSGVIPNYSLDKADRIPA